MEYDIIIIGGGMVGAAMANALRPTQLKIALIDATPLVTSADHRLIALNASSFNFLDKLQVWEQLAPHATAIKEVHVSHQGRFGITRMTANELKLSTLGYVVPAKFINAALYENLTSLTLVRPAKVTHLKQDAEKVSLTVETHEEIKTITGKIIIGADGSNSTVRDLLSIPVKKIDYQQSAIVTTTELHRSHGNVAYERFHAQGAIAMLPLSGNSAATIWTDTQENVSHLMKLNDADFLQVLQKQFGYRLGKLKNIGKRFIYPLQMIKPEKQISDRVILIGNAAHTVHPVAAQGLNLALYEVETLAKYFLNPPFPLFEKGGLERILFSNKEFSINLAHHLNWLFSKDFFILNQLRQMGMLGLDLCLPLKKQFASKALGHVGRESLMG